MQKLLGQISLTTTAQSIYVVPTGKKARVVNIYAYNSAAADRSVLVYAHGNAAANALLSLPDIAAVNTDGVGGTKIAANNSIELSAGEHIYAKMGAGDANDVVLTAYGIEQDA